MFPEIDTRPLAAKPAAGQFATGIAGPARRDRLDTPVRPLPAADRAYTATTNLRSLVLP